MFSRFFVKMFLKKRMSDSYMTVEASTIDDITLVGAEIGYTCGHISILCATGITSVKGMTVDVIMRCFATLVWL